jgi:putative LysE/RhtB family amino acid efflux pump
MDNGLFLKALVMGIAIAAPLGPVSLLCIQRMLTGGLRAGIAAGLGVACADTLYGAVAAFGASALAPLLHDHEPWLEVAGGAFLIALGLRSLRRPFAFVPRAPRSSARLAFSAMFLVTLANPMTILAFIALSAALGLAGGTPGAPLVTVAGIFVGAAGWWLALAGGIELVRNRIGPGLLRAADRAAGVVIAGFGVTVVVAALAS